MKNSRKQDKSGYKVNEAFSLKEVAIRMVEMPPLLSDIPFDGPEEAAKAMADLLKDYDREVFAVVNLKINGQPINMNIVSIGTLDSSLTNPREILKSMVLSNAFAVMLFHNHPSGNLNPSREDFIITNRMNDICDLIGIKLWDHIIIGPNDEFYSFHAKCKMPVSSLKIKTNSDDLHLVGVKVAEQNVITDMDATDKAFIGITDKDETDISEIPLSKQFIKIRESSGMNRKEFAEYLNIPYRTMQDWELGKSSMPKYVLELIDFKVKQELLPNVKEAPKKDSVIEKIQESKKIISPKNSHSKEKQQKEDKKQEQRKGTFLYLKIS